MVISAGFHKMLVQTGKNQIKQSDLGLHCLCRPFYACLQIRVHNGKLFVLISQRKHVVLFVCLI